jgi:hypothetical protein
MWPYRILPALFVLLALLARPAPAAAEAGEELTVSVLTMGPGDHPFFKFGHNAIWVHDATRDTDLVYNFGTFEFDSPWLIVDFLKGRFRYWLSVQWLDGTLAAYRIENRAVVAQELRLTPAERRQLAVALAVNARDENKYYKYDYYQDNCSTRVRDAIDAVVDGRLHAAARGPAEMSWRDHTRRLTANNLPIYLGLNIALAHLVDQPIDEWREMFLPSRLQEILRQATVPTPQGERPLVSREYALVTAVRPPTPTEPPHWLVPMSVVGMALGTVLALLGAAAARRRLARLAFATLVGALGLLLGLLGSIFLGLWLFTDHAVAAHNENLLQTAPWCLALVALAVGVARGRPSSVRRASFVAMGSLAASALGLLAKALPWFYQENGEIIALLLPLWAGLAAGLWLLWRGLSRVGETYQGEAPWSRRTLMGVQLLVCVPAMVSGVALAASPSGRLLGLGTDALADSPFSTYLLPGLVLFAINGVGQLLAWVAIRARVTWGGQLAAALGLFLMAWIGAQVRWLAMPSWLQPLMFACGAAELWLGVVIVQGQTRARAALRRRR